MDKLVEILCGINAEFADVRYETKNDISISFNGKELVEVGSNKTDGYVIRALKDGGLASIAVTRLDDVPEAIKRVVENAKIIGKNSEIKAELMDVPAESDTFRPYMDQDPREIDIDEKIGLTRHYNEIALRTPEIQSTIMHYFEVIRDKYYVNSSGTAINEETITTGISGRIIARRGDLVQDVRVGVGGSDGFRRLKGREGEFMKKADIARRLLDAEPVKAGTYKVLLNPDMTGVFTHEAFGHFSEADLIEHNESLREKMQLNEKIGSDEVDIIDDPTIKNQLGYYKYDDEGVPARPCILMKNGVLLKRLHGRRTAFAFDEPVTGHCIAEDYKYPPIVRMGNIFIKPREVPFQDLLNLVGNGLYVLDAKGGQTSGENFTFGAQYAYLIENGRLGPMVRDLNIIGNLFSTLKNIVAVGDDFELSEIGGCGKGQINIKSCHGGPHIVVKDMVVGGR